MAKKSIWEPSPKRILDMCFRSLSPSYFDWDIVCCNFFQVESKFFLNSTGLRIQTRDLDFTISNEHPIKIMDLMISSISLKKVLKKTLFLFSHKNYIQFLMESLYPIWNDLTLLFILCVYHFMSEAIIYLKPFWSELIFNNANLFFLSNSIMDCFDSFSHSA